MPDIRISEKTESKRVRGARTFYVNVEITSGKEVGWASLAHETMGYRHKIVHHKNFTLLQNGP